MLLVGLLPLLLGLSMAFYLGVREIQEANGANFQALAIETARKLDLVLAEEQAKNQRISKNAIIVQALEEIRDQINDQDPPAIDALLRQEDAAWAMVDSEFKKTIAGNPLTEILSRGVLGINAPFDTPTGMVARSATRALFITDVVGRVVASTDTRIPYLHHQEAWWQGAMHGGVGRPYIENMAYTDLFNSYTFTISVPVMDSIQYQAIGVLHRIYDVSEFFGPSIVPIRFGKTGHVMLIDSDGRVLSCPILTTGVQISDPKLVPLVTPPDPGWVLAPGDGHGGHDQSIIGFATLPTISRITLDSSGKNWHLFVWQSSEELFSAVYHLRTWISTFGGIALVLLLILGVLVSRRVVRPIRELQHAATLIANRELKEPIAIKTGDEIEDLAEELNRMNTQLQTAFSGLVSEVTTKTQEVEYLRESTEQILDGIPDPVVMVDEELQIQYMNRAFKQAAGVIGNAQNDQHLTELLSADTKERQRLASEIRDILSGRTSGDSGNGSEPGVLTNQLHDPLAQHRKDDTQSNSSVLKIKDRVFQSAWFQINPRPGENQKYGLVLRDATEDSRIQDQLISSEKFTSLGVLCSGIGHELNNPLVGVIGMGEAIQEESDLVQIKEHAKAIVQQGKRMAKVIQDLTGQIRGQSQGYLTPLDLNEQLDKLIQYMQITEHHPHVTVQKNYQTLPPFHGLPEDMKLVFQHLIKNSVQAMKKNGCLSITTHVADGNTIEICIEDTGTGIASEHLPKVFDPYFTTKSQGEGNGLGLMIVKRIVTKYGGQVKLESQEGKGTRCLITLPAQESVRLQRT